jgi:hypothetical protein
VSIIVCGCKKKEDIAPPAQKEEVKIIDASAIKPEFVHAFPMLGKYVYKFGNILLTEFVATDEEDFQIRSKLPDIVKIEYYIETNDSVETIYTFYRNIFDENVLRRYYAQDKLQSLVATDIFHADGYKDLPYEVQLKVSHPGRNFTDDVRLSQIEAIKKQIEQYEKIIEMQKGRLSSLGHSQDASDIESGIEQSKKRIKDLKIQSDLLIRQTALVHLSIKYLYVKPVEKIADKKPIVQP